MSARGGIYQGPGGQRLYGDGREGFPVHPIEEFCPDCGKITELLRGWTRTV